MHEKDVLYVRCCLWSIYTRIYNNIKWLYYIYILLSIDFFIKCCYLCGVLRVSVIYVWECVISILEWVRMMLCCTKVISVEGDSFRAYLKMHWIALNALNSTPKVLNCIELKSTQLVCIKHTCLNLKKKRNVKHKRF